MIKVENQILIYAFRYALGRQTYAPITVIESIKDNAEQLSNADITLIIKEIEECKNLGAECDRKAWIKLRDELELIKY